MIQKEDIYITVEDGNDGNIHIKSFMKRDDHQIFTKYLKKLLIIDENINEYNDELYKHSGDLSIRDIIDMYEENDFEVRYTIR